MKQLSRHISVAALVLALLAWNTTRTDWFKVPSLILAILIAVTHIAGTILEARRHHATNKERN